MYIGRYIVVCDIFKVVIYRNVFRCKAEGGKTSYAEKNIQESRYLSFINFLPFCVVVLVISPEFLIWSQEWSSYRVKLNAFVCCSLDRERRNILPQRTTVDSTLIEFSPRM